MQAGGRKGVVDRSGRMLVEPAFLSLVIHPVSFLITDDTGRWGALDRKGRMLIDPTHPSRVSVTMEIDRLLPMRSALSSRCCKDRARAASIGSLTWNSDTLVAPA